MFEIMSALFNAGQSMEDPRVTHIPSRPKQKADVWVQVDHGFLLDACDDDEVVTAVARWVMDRNTSGSVLDPVTAFNRLSDALERRLMYGLCIDRYQYDREWKPQALLCEDEDDPDAECYVMVRDKPSSFMQIVEQMMHSSIAQAERIEHIVEYQGQKLRFLILGGWVAGIFAA